jgi:hypothetical protein
MANRMTPVQAAKELGIRPQLVYGFIKHNRVSTFPNPSGKADHVDFDEVKRVAGSVKPHRPKGPDGKPVRRTPGLRRGDILSRHAYLAGPAGEKQKAAPHRVDVVTDLVKNEDGDVVLVVTQTGEGLLPMYWEAERLADRLKSGACRIESIAVLLGAVMHSWVATGEAEKAAGLQMWCEVNDIEFNEIDPVLEEEGSQPVKEVKAS